MLTTVLDRFILNFISTPSLTTSKISSDQLFQKKGNIYHRNMNYIEKMHLNTPRTISLVGYYEKMKKNLNTYIEIIALEKINFICR